MNTENTSLKPEHKRSVEVVVGNGTVDELQEALLGWVTTVYIIREGSYEPCQEGTGTVWRNTVAWFPADPDQVDKVKARLEQLGFKYTCTYLTNDRMRAISDYLAD